MLYELCIEAGGPRQVVAPATYEKPCLLLAGVAPFCDERPCCQRLPVSTRFQHYISNKVVVRYSVIELRLTCKFIVCRSIEGRFLYTRLTDSGLIKDALEMLLAESFPPDRSVW